MTVGVSSSRATRADIGDTAVVVPTVRGREAALERCLAGIRAQTRQPADVVVVRDCRSYASAIEEGVARTSAAWIAFLDDDAVPDATWLESLASHQGDPSVGAVGGRILNFLDGRLTARSYSTGPVARVSWFGRTVSKLHDIPVGRIVEDVHFLPGANMCFRRAALSKVDERLDRGMAPGFEMALCLDMRRRGWRVVFDSAAVVEHYPAPRPQHLDRDDRRRAAYEYSYMTTFTLLRSFVWTRKVAFLVYFFLLGQRASPGMAFAPWCVVRRRSRARYRAAWLGKLHGLRDGLA